MRSLVPWRRSRETEWRPFREFEDMEELFTRYFGRPFFEAEGFSNVPALDSFVRNGDLIVRADMPGIDPKDVEISVLGNVLTIRGERKAKQEAKEEDYIRHEIAYGSVERRMTLPQGVDAEHIKARYENGVLEISMPAPKELAPKKVAVKIETKH